MTSQLHLAASIHTERWNRYHCVGCLPD